MKTLAVFDSSEDITSFVHGKIRVGIVEGFGKKGVVFVCIILVASLHLWGRECAS